MILVKPDSDGMKIAAEAILDGEVIAYPTETLYGLAVDPFSQPAIERLFNVKKRESNNPVLLIVNDVDQLEHVASRISGKAEMYIKAFWPGPLSILFPKSDSLPASITAGGDKVCVRCPKCEIARNLCRVVGTAITSTSANLSGHAPARSISDIDFDGIAVAIDGGTLKESPPSTIIEPDMGLILREGVISSAQLNTIT